MPSHFKIKEYCPLVFRNLRERFAIDDQDYMESLTRYMNYLEIWEVLCSFKERIVLFDSGPNQSTRIHQAAAVPSSTTPVMVYLSSKLWLEKKWSRCTCCWRNTTLSVTYSLIEKCKWLLNVLSLQQYIVERHGKTLLPQYLGMYRLTVDGVENYLVVSRNVFSNHLPLHRYACW